MRSTRRAALQAGALVALADAFALRRAWGPWGERVAIAIAVAALVIGAALLLAPWLELLVDRGTAARRARSLGAALAAGILVGVPLATTATARRTIGLAAASIALPLAVAALLFALARAPRLVAALAGVGAIVGELVLPRRLYPSLRVLLLVGAFVALACALRRAGALRPRRALLVLAALALLAGGRALSDLDANTRFVTHVQAPAASLVLDAITAIAPPSPRALAATHTPAPTRPGARFAHAGSLADAHLVLVTVDALRADRLDRMPFVASLAARGVRFTHAYAAAPSTAASITSLLCARDPLHLDDRPPTLAERLRAAGWNTADFYPAGLFFDGGGALAHYAGSHFGVGWADTRTQPADAVTDAALARIRLAAARGEPRSFFWLHYFDPHEPYEPHELSASAPAIDRYDAEVRAVDRALARLVDGLGVFARPTLLVVTADHGEEFGEHGGAYHGSSLYDEQLRVPLVVALLGRHLEPERVDAPFSLADLAPTMTALVEADADDRLVGDVHAAVDTLRMIVRGSYKLIRDTRRDVDELYDLAADPREQHNLAGARPDVVAPLSAALEAWLARPSIAALAAAVTDRAAPPAARAAAARELGAREAYAGGSALVAALADGDATVRAEAALALASLTDHRARAPLHALLSDERFADRAAVMLGRLRDPSAAARLVALCRRPPADGDRAAATLRRDAAHYLGFVGDAGAVDALFAAAADPRVRGSAYVSIGRIAGRLDDTHVAARLRAQLAVEERADARADLATALALAAAAR